MRADGDVVIFADNVDVAVGRMGNHVYLGIARQEIGHYLAQGKLHGGNTRRATDDSSGLAEPLTYSGLGSLCFTQCRHRVPVKLFTRVRHSKPT